MVAPFSGMITGINVAAGQEIKKGSNLFSLDEFRISREIESAKRNLNIKKRNLDYAYKFSDKNGIETAKDDLKIAETSLLEVIWKKKNLFFVGIDVIGQHLTEINVTSPTGLQELERFENKNYAQTIWEGIEKKWKSEQ